jgi:hypothetical protein
MLFYAVSWKNDISWKLTVSIPDDADNKVLSISTLPPHSTIPYPKRQQSPRNYALFFLGINKESSIDYQFAIYHSLQKLRKVSAQHNISLARFSIIKSLCSGKYNGWKTPDNVQYSHHHCTSVTDTNHSATCKSYKVVGGVWQTI